MHMFRNFVELFRGLTHCPLEDLNEIQDNYIFELILVIGGWGISCEIALRWMSMDLPGN